MTNLMSKFLAMGMSEEEVIRRSTWNPAREIHHEELGHLSQGAVADVAVFSIATGNFGFTDTNGARFNGNRKLVCEMTIRNGRVVYDLNGISRPDWKTLPPDYGLTGDPSWDAVTPALRRPQTPRPTAP
jgi:dihydroorotase